MKILKNEINYLEKEHEEILSFCDKMEEKCIEVLNGNVDEEFFNKAIVFIRNYADGRHHKKEEDILFKAMLENLGPVAEKVVRGGMLVEHQMARNYVTELEKSLDDFKRYSCEKNKLYIITSAMSYVTLLRNHAEKENEVVYPFALKNLPEDIKKKVAMDLKKRIDEEMKNNFEKEKLMRDLGI